MEDQQPLAFQDLQIKVPGGFLSGRWYGNRSVRPILALHGWQDNLGTWTPILPLLPQHIGILCIDFPGHGRSSGNPNGISHHVINCIHTIQSVIKEYKWHKVSLMGHSLGAVVSYMYAALYPETIDLLIQIDIIKTPCRSPEFLLKRLETFTEKLLTETERYHDPKEPPSYYFDELVEIHHRGSAKSVNKENCKHLIERSCKRSANDPQKLYFSRDPKVKFYWEYTVQHDYRWEETERIKNVNYLVIKGKESKFIDADSFEMVQQIKANNPNFEFYELEGTHHIHLNNPQEVAAIIFPFICKYRPPETVGQDIDTGKDETENRNILSKL